MRPIKVLLAIRPRMLAEIVSYVVQQQPDLILVSDLLDPHKLAATIQATGAEVVILTVVDAGRAAEQCRPLLAAYPHLKIIALAATKGTTFIYQSGLPTTRLDDIGVESMLRAIREVRR